MIRRPIPFPPEGQNEVIQINSAAALAAYGFSAMEDLLQQLRDLNLEVAARIDHGEPVISPGIPPDFLNSKSLTSCDCIRLPEK